LVLKIDNRILRNVASAFATGVTVVTIEKDQEVYGMTANSFLSVSLSPALVLISVQKSGKMHPLLKKDKALAISILEAGQTLVSEYYAGKIDNGYQPDYHQTDGDWHTIPNCLAWYHTHIVKRIDGGDHTLVLCEVKSLGRNEGDPLLYFSGYKRIEK
jgi:flavin reductase (DIM6/NTAB) family NADH-FMN oxidoreductase RutF